MNISSLQHGFLGSLQIFFFRERPIYRSSPVNSDIVKMYSIQRVVTDQYIQHQLPKETVNNADYFERTSQKCLLTSQHPWIISRSVINITHLASFLIMWTFFFIFDTIIFFRTLLTLVKQFPYQKRGTENLQEFEWAYALYTSSLLSESPE